MTVVRTPGGGTAQVRGMFAGTDTIPTPAQADGWASYAGRSVNGDEAVGLPAAGAAVRLLAETAGELPLVVRRNDGDEKERLPDSPQWALLHDEPNLEQSPFDFIHYLVASLQQSNAYLLKTKSRGVVRELIPLDPNTVAPFYKNGQMQYRVYRNGTSQVLTRTDLIHIPGLLWRHPYIGVSPVQLHRNSMGTALATEEYGGRWFANDGQPGGAISVKGPLNSVQAREMLAQWNERHGGVGNSHRTGLLTNGATYTPFGVNLKDALYIEAQNFGVEQVARIYRVPPEKIGAKSESTPGELDAVNQDFLTYSLLPWLRRIVQGLARDRDLFPDRTVVPEFVVEGLLRADTKTRFEAYMKARQGGIYTANEIRAKEDMPPIEGGDQLQLTPVGGAPNPGGEPTPEDQKVEASLNGHGDPDRIPALGGAR